MLARKKQYYIVGIDEVGRGCLVGTVVVAAVALMQGVRYKFQGLRLKDSKKLSEKQRAAWFRWIKTQNIFYAVARCQPKTIDRINISRAANRAATRALKKLLVNSKWQIENRKSRLNVLLDGGLYLNKITNYHLPITNCRTIVRADEKYNCVKLASIVAKVHRDKFMKRIHKKYPKYGFDRHVGYGTKIHIRAIKKYGLCELHRLSFVGNIYRMSRPACLG